MKTNMLNWSILTAIFFLSFSLSSCSDDDEDDTPPVTPPAAEVVFPDEFLEAQVKLALGLSADQTIDEQNILALDTLNINGSDDLPGGPISSISDLTGLEAAVNLIYLRFGGTAVTDLSPISDLTNIQYLRMNNTGVTDLSPISGYTTLTYFNANSTIGITDISPLSGNSGLKVAILRAVPFGDAGMSTVANWTTIYRINMRDTGVTDIAVLVELMEQGALLDSTPGAAEAGGADLDLRGLSIDCSLLDPFTSQISNLDGC